MADPYGGGVIGGPGPIPGGKQGIYEQSVTQKAPIGQILPLGDGRAFTYARAGGGLTSGKIALAPADVDNHLDLAVAVSAAIGDKQLTVTLGATLASVDQYKEGYVSIVDAGSQGIYYKVRSHPAAALSTSLTLNLYDEIIEAITAGTDVASLAYHAYSQVVHAASQARMPVGVPLIDITDQYYCWLQTWGHCTMWIDEATTDGIWLTTGANDAGGAEDKDAAGEPGFAYARTAGSGINDFCPVYLMIQR